MYQIEPRQLTPLLIVAEVDHDLPAGLLRFYRIDRLAAEARRLTGLGLRACKLYVKTPAGRKDEHATAGADVVVAGLTHEGSIRAMRTALDESGHKNVQIQGSVQLRTGFYGPYRTMMGTEPEAGETFRAHQPQTDRDAVMSVARRHVEEGRCNGPHRSGPVRGPPAPAETAASHRHRSVQRH